MVELAIVFHCPVQDDFGETALAAAVRKGHLHVAEILVKNGADVNYRDNVRESGDPCNTCMQHVLFIADMHVVVHPFDANKIFSVS